jgi:hypothetical protein
MNMRLRGWTALLVAGVLALPAARAEAQAPAAGAKLAGTWSGDYTTDGPSGTMTLTIAKEGEGWKVTNSLGDAAPPSGDVREVVVEGDKITWKQIFGEYDVAFTATVGADGKLAGTLEATQGGSVAGGGSFTLVKK